MWDYSDKVKDHFLNPRNARVIEDANAVGDVGVVTEINVPEKEVEAFKDRLKPIICKLGID